MSRLVIHDCSLINYTAYDVYHVSDTITNHGSAKFEAISPGRGVTTVRDFCVGAYWGQSSKK